MKYIVLTLLSLLLFACGQNKPTPKVGEWRAVFELDKDKEIPFLFDYTADNVIIIKNGEEQIEVSDIEFKKDSIFINHPVFEGVFKGVYTRDSIYGNYLTPSLDRSIPFKMIQGRAERIDVKQAPNKVVEGVWETTFSPNTPEDSYIAKGIFEQVGHKVTGTFRTTTGDYRFLEGAVENDSLRLSTFDGAHLFLFEAEVSDSTMNGTFYSGNHWKEPFIAKRNESFELPKSDSLTFLKEGYDKIEFTFPNTNGKEISLSDDEFKGKVVLVQIMGTWCPNCLDETKYYSDFYRTKNNEDFEIVALAFEYAKTEEKAMESINKFKKGANVPYPILLAQYGTSSKSKANEKLPMLNHVLSYPTTIFIDKQGMVRRIHTGFNGPATKDKYTEFTEDFEAFVNSLLAEE